MAVLGMSQARRLAGRRALVTGAARGQGRSVALRFAAEGAQIGLTDIDAASLEAVAAEIRELGASAVPVAGDVRSTEDVRRIVETVAAELGGLDTLYNNAGVYASDDTLVGQLDDALWGDILSINVGSVYRFCHCSLPYLLREEAPAIVNVSSVAGYAGDDRTSAYPASKGAIIALTKSIAQQYGRDGLRANVICPGLIDTPMVSDRIADEELLSRILASTALGRPGQPEEVAAVAAFLVSEDASYVTASVLTVHGGMRR